MCVLTDFLIFCIPSKQAIGASMQIKVDSFSLATLTCSGSSCSSSESVMIYLSQLIEKEEQEEEEEEEEEKKKEEFG